MLHEGVVPGESNHEGGDENGENEDENLIHDIGRFPGLYEFLDHFIVY